MPARRARPAGALTAALVVLLTACTAGGEDPSPASSATVDPGPGPEDVVASPVVPEGGTEVRVDVHPVVRDGDLAVLTLDLTPLEDLGEDGSVTLHGFGGPMATNLRLSDPANVRLVDLERDVVHHAAVDADTEPVVAPKGWERLRGPEGTRLQIPYAAPDADVTEMSLFLPGAPLVASVPVIDGDVPSSVRPDAPRPTATSTATPSPEPERIAVDRIVAAPVFPLDSASAELEGAVKTVESTERVDVQLGADVLFEFDQATLTPAAGEAIALVAARIAEREPGTVSVVGHTDDQGDDAYNLDLSRRRAQAVADALGPLVGSGYRMQVDGRGEAEPFVANDSDENRALNRRVAVSLTSTVTTRTDVTATGELPPFGDKGLVGQGEEPLLVDSSSRRHEVQASARTVHGHVVVDLTVRGVDDYAGTGMVLPSLRGWSSHRGQGTDTPLDVAGRAVILDGASKLYPMDYRIGTTERAPDGEWLTLTDLRGATRIDGGQSRVYSFVYPRMATDAVTFQVGSGSVFDTDFRIVDVPVRHEARD